MSLSDKLKKSIQGNNDAKAKKKLPQSGPAKFKDSEKVILDKMRQSNGSVTINIPLNQELSEDHGVVNLSRYKEDELDFDFTNLFDEDTIYPESEVLSINPVRSFSRQVDIDLDALAQKGFVTPHTVNTLLGNTFRMIKRPLLNNIMGKGATVTDRANLVMLTSSVEGEGKTFSAINLAISMAMEKDKHVLLIDADVNKPSHHEIFDIETDYGLIDLLQGKVRDMSKVLHKTNIPSLTLMFAGNKTSHATELLASQAMEKFITEISNFYKDRVIIFDSPPLLLPTEAGVLASHMGQVIVVVEAESTHKQLVDKSLEMLSNKIVLLLLNKAREKTLVGNYGHYMYQD